MTQQPSGVLAKAARRVGVNPGDRRLAFWLTLLFATTQASHGLGMNAADTLFFLRFGVERLPTMILISGLVVMGAITLHVVGFGVVGSTRWLVLIAALGGTWLVIERAVVTLAWEPIYPVIWVANQAIVMVTLTMMWNAAEQSCDTRQAKRLFPLFAAAGVAGGVVGNLVTGPLAATLGTANLLLVQAGLLFTSSVLLLRARRFFRSEPTEEPSSMWASLASTPARVMSTRLGRLAGVAVLLVSTLFFLVVFPFNEVVAASYDSEVGVATFLGLFSSVATAATFLFSLFATRWLFVRLGVVLTMILVPTVYAVGFALWLTGFGLTTATVIRGLQWVAVNAIWGTAFPAVFNVLPGRQRSQALGFMTAVPAQIGTVAAGALLIAGDAVPQTVDFAIGLALALAGMWAVYSMRPAYLDSVVAAVRSGLAEVFTLQHREVANLAERDAIDVLGRYVQDDRPQARAFAVSALARVGDRSSLGQMRALLNDPSPKVRSAAIDSMCTIAPDDVVDHLADALEDESATVRLQAVRYLTGEAGIESTRSLAGMLDDEDPRVRASAAVGLDNEDGARVEREMLASGEPRLIAAVLEESARTGRPLRGADAEGFLDHHDTRVRIAAVEAGAGATDPHTLVERLDDASPGVRRACAQALASTPEGRGALLDVLQTGTVNATDAALRALIPMGDPEPRLVDWAAAEATRAAKLARLRRAVERTDPSPALYLLTAVLGNRSERLVGWVIAAMTTSETQGVMATVERGVRSSDPETKSQAVEALETIGARPVLEVLIPLLEPTGTESHLGRREAFEQLINDFDPWLRALAMRALAEELVDDLSALEEASSTDTSDIVRSALPGLPNMSDSSVETLDTMNRVLALHAVPMFADLDPEDLELIADTTTEVRFERGERIYEDGAPGSEMLVIIEGGAVVTKLRNGDRVTITEYGPGEIVGELAPLVGGRRTADVDSGDQGLHGLRLDRVDLLSILEERPTVGMGMLGTLATRLIEQT